MNVREMIDNLESLIASDSTIADLAVVAEGCDCEGAARSVRVESGDGFDGAEDGTARYLLVSRGAAQPAPESRPSRLGLIKRAADASEAG